MLFRSEETKVFEKRTPNHWFDYASGKTWDDEVTEASLKNCIKGAFKYIKVLEDELEKVHKEKKELRDAYMGASFNRM